MKTFVIAVFLLCLSLSVVAEDAALSTEEQLEIITNYMLVTGQGDRIPASFSQALEETEGRLPAKCGTPAVTAFLNNRDNLDKDLVLAMRASVFTRPVLQFTYDSPQGIFKFHYNKTGDSAVYQANIDSDFDGVPNYVEDVAMIADSVYDNIINVLGYPIPPSDGFYSSGGDSLYDVYLLNLRGGAYGLDYADSISLPDNIQLATSFIVLDNDYQEFFIYDEDYHKIYLYRDRPLDAVRVTMAHEYFHAVQFGMDFFESGVVNNLTGRYWMEMSSTWMEEQLYDQVNDYYNYLPAFFNYPRNSIQQFKSLFFDAHPYASVVFPIFLTENYGPDIIRAIWEHCAELGPGPHFLFAAGEVIDSVSGGLASWPSVFRDFALWNYFTGNRSDLAPNDIGYQEKANYPAIPLDSIDVQRVYPLLVRGDRNPYNPQHNAATYVRFEETRTMQDRYWRCNDGSMEPLCFDTVVDLVDTIICDSVACMNFNCDELLCDSVNCFSYVCDTIALSLDTTITICRRDKCFDSTKVDSLSDYDKIDSIFYVSFSYDTLPQPWGLSIVYQLAELPDSHLVSTFLLPAGKIPGPGSTYFLPFANVLTHRPQNYQSITYIFSPASIFRDYYEPLGYRRLGYYVPEDGTIDQNLVDLQPAVLYSYPNPAVVSEMQMSGVDSITFRFQVPTDSTSFAIYENPKLVVDIFNVAGEYVQTVEKESPRIYRIHEGVYAEVGWDMKNAAGEEVSSGVYIGYARLYSDRLNAITKKRSLLIEDYVKVAIIR